MIEVIRYSADKKQEWDDFVMESDTPIFLFNREYMEYHADRFEDYSILVYNKKNKPIALLPGHLVQKTFYSHLGLTFGGFILNNNTSYEDLVLMINEVNVYLKGKGIENVVIKQLPFMYMSSLSQTQEFILRRNSIELLDIKLSSFIFSKNHVFPKSSIEKRKLNLNQFEYCNSDDFNSYWQILQENLKYFHSATPVHTLDEMLYLKKRFPKNILLKVVNNKDTGMLDAGALLYSFKNILKLQYMATSHEGRKNRAGHALYYSFINESINSYTFIDLGNSMKETNIINSSLLYVKERYGSTVYQICSYSYKTTKVFK